MTDALSPEQLADRELLRKLFKDEVQGDFELGYLVSKHRTSVKHLAKDKDGKPTTIFVDSFLNDMNLLCPKVCSKLNKKANFYRPSRYPSSELPRYLNEKKNAEKDRLERTTKRVESMKEKCSQQWTALFNKGEIETQHKVIEKTEELDVV